MTVQANPPRIKILPPLLVNQIAAGEVVDRPASVVKELVENAIDADASRISVELESGGIELIRISDDGRGIPEDDLPLALAPHATSKITATDDLDRIITLGFRGEALASITSVARVRITSRTITSRSAYEIAGEGAGIGGVMPAAASVGTTVNVRNLFFNTPARRKFLRSPAAEQARCLDVIHEQAMARPAIGFRVVCDGRVVIDYQPDASPRERAMDILGRELESQLLEVSSDAARDATIWGLVGTPAIARATQKSQYILLNGRPIRDKVIQHALREAYRGLMEPSRHPTAVLLIEIDPTAVDVNVHPAKAEVRFRDGGFVHTLVLRAVRDALMRADLTPAVHVGGAGGASSSNVWGGRAVLPTPQAPQTPEDRAANTRAFVDYFKRFTPARPEPTLNAEHLRNELAPEVPRAQPASHAPSIGPAHSDYGLIPTPTPQSRVLQVHNSYLVTQDESGVVIVDQHALHERVMFEALLARIEQAPLESQRLLTPVVVQAAPAQIERLPALAALFARLGIEAEAMSPTSIAVHAFPSFLFDRGVDPEPLLTDLLEKAENAAFEPTSEEALRDVLDMMACKAAVKAGDKLSDDELDALVTLRDAVERSSSCPHGRPTSVRLSIRDLERMFHRT